MTFGGCAMETLLAKRYWLHEPFGVGGMGIVYRATDRLTGQVLALKRVTGGADNAITDSTSHFTDFRMALAREFKLLATLHHPHIVTVLDYGFDEERQPFFTMELIEEAQSFINGAADRPLLDQVHLLLNLLEALTYLHRRGIFH